MVLSYTNHALDQFMEDLLDADIPSSSMVRIGYRAKCSPNTAPLLLWEQKAKYHHSTESRLLITNLRERAAELGEKLQDDLNKYLNLSTKWEDIAEYLEFADEELPFLDALRVPTDSGGWERKGKRNKDVKPNYLYRRWIKGDGPGVFADELPEGAKAVWDLPANVREAHNDRWTRALLEERLDDIRVQHREYNDIQDKLDAQFSQKEAKVLQDRSILGCTTTAAAKYAPLIRTFEPSAVIVEEAGEILEAHILTALAPTVKQLVLIGDHKQLRPKINNYALSVEAGEGFDLNCSLFERLIEQGALYTTLCTQHRMAREISRFARELTYPHLRDGPNTADRPPIRGLRDRVVFVHHGRREDSDRQLRERREAGVKESKRNQFEAEMVLRCVKYLGQQGYSTDNMVVLTPYLGQVRALRDLFRKNNHDAALSDLDKAELLRAGLISEATALIVKTPLRISTIGESAPDSFRHRTQSPSYADWTDSLLLDRQLPGRGKRHRDRVSDAQQRERRHRLHGRGGAAQRAHDACPQRRRADWQHGHLPAQQEGQGHLAPLLRPAPRRRPPVRRPARPVRQAPGPDRPAACAGRFRRAVSGRRVHRAMVRTSPPYSLHVFLAN